MPIKITQLITYPIKSCAGISLQSTTIDAMGLPHDRQWMLTDPNGKFLSQRQFPQMALIQPTLNQGTIQLDAPGMPSLISAMPDAGELRQVTVWRDSLMADGCDPKADAWLSAYLNSPVHLVRYGQSSQRQIDLEYASPGQQVAFADGYPLLVTHQASLDQLNNTLSRPVPMNRFRPNVVVTSEHAAWQELNWQQLSTSHWQIQLMKPCSRCVMTGVDQQAGASTGTEVLKTLKQQFPHQDKAVFGINGVAKVHQGIAQPIAVGQILGLQQQ